MPWNQLHGVFLGVAILAHRSAHSLVFSIQMLAALYVEIRGATPKHYHIRQTPEGQYYLSDKHLFKSIPELIYYHKLNAGGRL